MRKTASYGIASLVASIAIQGLLAPAVRAAGQDSAAKAKPPAVRIVPPGGRAAERTVAEWGETWWQWLLAAPNVHDPALDETGEKCHFGQLGPVWFLAGSYGSAKVIRRCTVPQGKYVLFPAVNVLVKPQPGNDVDCAYALDRATRAADAIVAPYATLDGRAVGNIKKHRERTGACFDPASTGRKVSATEGYWVMLGPLAAGKHVLKFGNNESGPAHKDVTVLLTVARSVPFPEYEPWPNPAAYGGVSESPTMAGRISWNVAAAIMPVTPDFGGPAVMRRAAALIARDARYTLVRAKAGPMGSDLWLSVAPRDVAGFDGKSPEIAREFHSPVWIWTEAPREGKVQFIAGNLVLHGAGQAHGLEVSRDIQRFLYQALDKKIAVTDHEIRAALAAVSPTWEELTRHRPPAPERTPEQEAATREFIRSSKAMAARASEATQPAPGRVFLKGEYPGTVRISPDGLSVERCCGFAYSVAKATRAHSYGKHYFEAELNMPPTRSEGATMTNMGLVYGNESAYGDEVEHVFEHGEASRHEGGTVVGIAADLDAQRLYVHINGVWLAGAPGGNAGRRLKTARAYTAVFAVGSPQGKEEESDAWTANFGARPFRYSLPAGYAPYDRQ